MPTVEGEGQREKPDKERSRYEGWGQHTAQ